MRTNTVLGYNWNNSRVSLTWLFRKGTEGLLTTNRPSPTIVGYPSNNLFNLNGGTKFGPVDVSVTISNLFDKEPDAGGYFVDDATQGFGTYDPYGDLVGRRYSLSFHDGLLSATSGGEGDFHGLCGPIRRSVENDLDVVAAGVGHERSVVAGMVRTLAGSAIVFPPAPIAAEWNRSTTLRSVA